MQNSLRNEQHVQFILLAEFDIDQGSVLTHQYPFPTGTDEQQLAELMVPDGVHGLKEDWTIFFLNQSSKNSIKTPFLDNPSEEGHDNQDKSAKKDLLYVLNLVRTKHDATVRRGALVKALAVCTSHPYIHIFKPVLILALDNYFAEPSVNCLARLFDCLNAMDLSMVPSFSRHEKLILRMFDDKNIFKERFESVAQDGLLHPAQNSDRQSDTSSLQIISRSTSDPTLKLAEGMNHNRSKSVASLQTTSDASLVLVDEDNGRRSIDVEQRTTESDGSTKVEGSTQGATMNVSSDSLPRRLPVKMVDHDSRFYVAPISYGELAFRIKVPLYTFHEEVGDFSLISLIQTFSGPNVVVTGPLHPHLHSNGPSTHPVIVLFNAMITHKRVIFVGHGKPAGYVSNFVLAACALASGSGCYLRGFTERAFPYVNLTTKDILDPFASTGYIAGVTNPIFQNIDCWDVICNVVNGSITIHKDIAAPPPTAGLFPAPPTLLPKGGVLRADTMGGEDEFGRLQNQTLPGNLPKTELINRADCYDTHFMEDILATIQFRAGEAVVRARFAEYVNRFIQLASRYEEEVSGSTSIGYPCTSFSSSSNVLGSGIKFADDVTLMRELQANAARIEGWRKTASYENWVTDFQEELDAGSLSSIDIEHQILRLRNGKNVPDEETYQIIKTLLETVQTEQQLIELLSHLPPQYGGLQPIATMLFHQREDIREMTVDFFTNIRKWPVGSMYLQTLNQFYRYMYIRLAYEQEMYRQQLEASDPHEIASNNHSEVSLGGQPMGSDFEVESSSDYVM